MKFLALLSTCVATACAATASDILKTLATLNSDTQSATKFADQWDQKYGQWFFFAKSANNAVMDLESLNSDFSSSGAFNQSDSNKIAAYFNSPVSPDTVTLAQTVVKHKAQCPPSAVPVTGKLIGWLRGNTSALCHNFSVKLVNGSGLTSAACAKALNAYDTAGDAF